MGLDLKLYMGIMRIPRDPDCPGYLELGDPVMLAQLDDAARSGPLEGDRYPAYEFDSRACDGWARQLPPCGSGVASHASGVFATPFFTV